MASRVRTILLFLAIAIGQGDAEITLDEATARQIERGMEHVDSNRHDEGLMIFREIVEDHPDRPLGYFLMAATYQTIMRDYRTNCYEAVYDSLLDRAIVIGEEAVRADRRDALARFYLGGAYGYRGLYKVRTREWLGAFSDGLKGLTALERSLELDPTLYDAYYGLGLYHYWRSAKADILGFISPFKRDKKRGIAEMWRAVRFGRFCGITGRYALVATYYDFGKFEEAWAVNEELHVLFPDNPSCLYMRSRLCQAMGNWPEMLRAATRLHRRIETAGYGSIGYFVECLYLRAFAQEKLGNREEVSRLLDRALSLAEQRDASKEIEGPLEDFDEILEAVVELRASILEPARGRP